MKVVGLTIIIVFTAVIAKVYCGDCSGPDDNVSCTPSECCIKNALQAGYKCQDKGHKIGDACGGEFNCNCHWGLTCIPLRSKRGAGTCQNTGYLIFKRNA
ncbi:hypothetical protein CHUAL_005246 [Chamberlinius hualienensis]